MIDAYIKRIKSAFFTAFLALLVGLSLAWSRSGLADAHLQAKRWYWVGIAMAAEVGDGSEIDSIGGVSKASWRLQHPELPKYGKVLDVVRNLTDHEIVVGRIAAPSSRVIDFQATPLKWEEDPNCLMSPERILLRCSRYVLSQDGTEEEVVYFVYQKAASGEAAWSAPDKNTSTLLDLTAVEDRVVSLSEPWVGKRGGAGAAFDALLDRLNSQTIKLPGLNLDLPARLASAALALFALVSSYLGATSLAGLDRCYDAAAQREPWILQQHPAGTQKWTHLISASLTSVSRVSGYVQVWLPTLLFAVAFWLSPTNTSSFFVAACVLPSLFLMAYSTSIFRSLLRRMT